MAKKKTKSNKKSAGKPKPVKVKKVKKIKIKRAPVMSREQLEKYRSAVLAMRGDQIELIEQKKHKDLPEVEIGDEVDTASQMLDKEMNFEVTNTEKEKLDSIEGALRKIENKTFGMCESCGKKIANDRLRVVPWARYCITCQKKSEKPE